MPSIKSKVDVQQRNGDIYKFHLSDVELVQAFRHIGQVVAHLTVTLPEHVKEPNRELSNIFMRMLYRPDIHQHSLDFGGTTTGQAQANLLFLDRYKPTVQSRKNREYAALVAVNEFHFYNDYVETYHTVKPPEADARKTDFVLELVGMNGYKYLGIEVKGIDRVAMAMRANMSKIKNKLCHITLT